jgi:serine/threonine protein kinase
MTIAFAFAVSALRVKALRSDFWNAGIYFTMVLAGLAEMRMASGGGIVAARLYLLGFAIIVLLVSVGAHAQYAKLVFSAEEQRQSRRRLIAYALFGGLNAVGLFGGFYDHGQVHTNEMWGAHATVVSANWWGAVLMGLYASGNVLVNKKVLLAPGPRAFERRLVAGSMFAGPVFVVWEILVITGVNPYLPIAGYFVTLLGLNGAMVLIERFRNLSEQGGMIGGWVIERRLGGGGMADVFLGHREGVDELRGVVRRAAIKRLRAEYATNPQFVEMFLDEARVASRLSHSNVVNLYDVGKQDSELFMAMEVVDGASLGQIFQMLRHRGERLQTEALVEIALQLCEALDYVHALKDDAGRPLDLVHRDVSPQNVLVDRSGTVKLADFGIARSVDRSSHTATGVIKGKVSYMAPEQLRGESYDHRVDLYALGVVLFEIGTGHRLYEGVSEQALLFRVVRGDPPPLERLADLTPPLAEVIRRALTFAVEERAPRAADLRAALLPLRQLDRGRAELARAVAEATEWQDQREQASSNDTKPVKRPNPA